jgi:hypothetical protein
VKRGGIKKKFQMKALSAAESKTGKISNVIASKDTVTNKTNAATLYPIKPDNPRQIAATRTIIAMLNRYCLPLLIVVNKSPFING